MAKHLRNVIYVYDKNKKLIAKFGEEQQGLEMERELSGLSADAMREMMVSPVVHIESNGASTFTFQMLANSIKWQSIKDPENLYYVNGRYYTPLTENAYEYSGEDTARIVTVTCVETWYLLSRKYNQAYNCGIYCYAKAHFVRKTATGAVFKIWQSDCSNPGNTISQLNAFNQVKKWRKTDDNNNVLSYAILTDKEHKPTNWENAPAAVNIKEITTDNLNWVELTIENRVQAVIRQTYEMPKFNDGQYAVYIKLTDENDKPLSINPEKINKVILSYTEHETTTQKKWNSELKRYEKTESKTTFKNLEIEPSFAYTASSDTVQIITQSLPKQKVEQVGQNDNPEKTIYRTYYGVTIEYPYNNMGEIKSGATCTLAYGAEVVDEHTFVILPKADTRYKLTINGTQYEDSAVKDQRGVIMPRGSGGYAMWAALHDTGWGLGICDVIAKDFDPSIDYGCFNVEEDMKDVLTNIQNIRSVYGGILVWDSENKLLHYRAENSEDYQAHTDDFNKWKGYVFREGKNITNQPVITYDNDIITKAYLIGYDNLNVRNVNNGKSYIEDYSYTNQVYEGYLSQELIYDTNDEGGQKQLLYWGRKELKKRCKPRRTFSLEVTDVRTVNGLEHEVFDINDIVKVYYHDSHDNTEHVEEQRVILWEYNVFAYWDCQVELGDKTSNLTEIFKLVYNKSLTTPDTNGSGQLPGGQISSGSNMNNVFGGNNNTITGRFNLISQTTTANTDAISGLVIDTSYNYAYAQLFAQFQQAIGDVISQTYAGLTVYADDKSASVKAEAEGHWESLAGDLQEEVDARMAFQIGINKEMSGLGYTFEQRWKQVSNDLTTETNARINFEKYVTSEMGVINDEMTQNFKEVENGIITLSNTVSRNYNYFQNKYGAIEQDIISFENELNGKVSYNSMTRYVDEQLSYIDIRSEVADALGFIYVGSDYIYIYNTEKGGNQSNILVDPQGIETNGQYTTINTNRFWVEAGETIFSHQATFDSSVYMDNGGTVYMNRLEFDGMDVQWKTLDINGNTATVLGWSGR